MGLFYNPAECRLRALWRLLLQGALMFAFGAVLILAVAEPLHDLGVGDREINMVLGPLLTLAIFASVLVAARWIDHRDVRELGLPGRWSDFFKGLAIGGLLMAIVFAIELGVGWIEITGFGVPLHRRGDERWVRDLRVGGVVRAPAPDERERVRDERDRDLRERSPVHRGAHHERQPRDADRPAHGLELFPGRRVRLPPSAATRKGRA